MHFGVKNLPFISTTFHHLRRWFAPEANVAVIARLQCWNNFVKIKVINGFDSFFYYSAANVYGYIHRS